jgi:hypothetical protein
MLLMLIICLGAPGPHKNAFNSQIHEEGKNYIFSGENVIFIRNEAKQLSWEYTRPLVIFFLIHHFTIEEVLDFMQGSKFLI